MVPDLLTIWMTPPVARLYSAFIPAVTTSNSWIESIDTCWTIPPHRLIGVVAAVEGEVNSASVAARPKADGGNPDLRGIEDVRWTDSWDQQGQFLNVAGVDGDVLDLNVLHHPTHLRFPRLEHGRLGTHGHRLFDARQLQTGIHCQREPGQKKKPLANVRAKSVHAHGDEIVTGGKGREGKTYTPAALVTSVVWIPVST